MDSQEIKERYQQLLEEYHSKKIDWKTFEMRLLELKLMRSQAATDPESPAPETERSFFRPAPPVTPHTKTVSLHSGRFSLDVLPGEGGTTRHFRPPVSHGMPLGVGESGEGQTVGTSHFKATGPLQAPRRGNRLNAGVRLGNDYRLHRFLGVGQCGETWMAEEIATKNFVVLKPIPPQIQNEDTCKADFQKIYRRVSRLKYPGIRPLFRLAKDETLGLFTVSAYVDAVPLDEFFEQYRRRFHGFPVAVIVRLLWPIARALDYAHRHGVVHRSLTPNNLLVGRHCGSVVTDFWAPTSVREELHKQGISSDAEDGAAWRAPEVWLENRHSPRSDQYSLGALAYQLILGHRPFRGKSEEELRERVLLDPPPHLEKLPEELAGALRRVLSKSPEDRFDSCLDFVAQLDRQGSQGTEIRPTDSEKDKPRRGLWSVLFGAAAMPESVTGLSFEDIWPFETDEVSVSDPAEANRMEISTFPYKKRPKGLSGPSLLDKFGAAPLALGGGVGAIILGGVLLLGPSASEKNEKPAAPPAASPTASLPIPPAVPKIDTTPVSDSQKPTVSTPSIHKVLEENAAEVQPKDVDRLGTLAAAGDVNAQRQLGEAYFYGKGISRDRKRAVEYFQLGAAQEDVSSLYHLARCYELGIGGLNKSNQRAIELYKVAAENGSEAASEALDRLEIIR